MRRIMEYDVEYFIRTVDASRFLPVAIADEARLPVPPRNELFIDWWRDNVPDAGAAVVRAWQWQSWAEGTWRNLNNTPQIGIVVGKSIDPRLTLVIAWM
jgi:hypothetical protein